MDIEAYKNLLPLENQTKVRFMSYLEAVLSHMVSLGIVDETIGTAFDLDNAAGNQLDTIGELVGLGRLLSYVPATGTREMDDDEYRLALKLKIARNEWDGTNGDAVKIYDSVFGNEFLVVQEDNQNMTVTISFYGAVSSRQAEIVNASGTFLIPCGVGYTVNFVGGECTFNLIADVGITGIEHEDGVIAM